MGARGSGRGSKVHLPYLPAAGTTANQTKPNQTKPPGFPKAQLQSSTHPPTHPLTNHHRLPARPVQLAIHTNPTPAVAALHPHPHPHRRTPHTAHRTHRNVPPGRRPRNPQAPPRLPPQPRAAPAHILLPGLGRLLRPQPARRDPARLALCARERGHPGQRRGGLCPQGAGGGRRGEAGGGGGRRGKGECARHTSEDKGGAVEECGYLRVAGDHQRPHRPLHRHAPPPAPPLPHLPPRRPRLPAAPPPRPRQRPLQHPLRQGHPPCHGQHGPRLRRPRRRRRTPLRARAQQHGGARRARHEPACCRGPGAAGRGSPAEGPCQGRGHERGDGAPGGGGEGAGGGVLSGCGEGGAWCEAVSGLVCRWL